MRFFWTVLSFVLLVGFVVPSEAGLDPSKKKVPKLIQPGTKKYKNYSTKKYATKTKKTSKTYKTKSVKKTDVRKPVDESARGKDKLIANHDLRTPEVVEVKQKSTELIAQAEVEQVADENPATITKTKKLKKKEKVSQSDINQYSKVKDGKTEGITVTPAGEE